MVIKRKSRKQLRSRKHKQGGAQRGGAQRGGGFTRKFFKISTKNENANQKINVEEIEQANVFNSITDAQAQTFENFLKAYIGKSDSNIVLSVRVGDGSGGNNKNSVVIENFTEKQINNQTAIDGLTNDADGDGVLVLLQQSDINSNVSNNAITNP